MIDISVVMLMHNREKYVGQAIKSILDQTYRNFEFIIVDNNSKDNSLRIAKKYQGEDPRIVIYESGTENIGAGRNVGLAKVTGKYFTFIDDDDYCLPTYLEFLYNLAESYRSDITVCGSYYDFNGKWQDKYVYDQLVVCNKESAMRDFLLRQHFNNGNATKLFRCTDVIREIVYDEGKRYDDIHTMYKYFASVGNQETAVVAQGKPLYCVRRHDTNNSSAILEYKNLNSDWLEEYLEMYRSRTTYIMEKIPSLEMLAKWSEWSFMISMIDKINQYSLAQCKEQLCYMERIIRNHKSDFLNAEWTRDFEKKWVEKYI